VATKSGHSASGSLLELVLIVAVALGLALGIQAFLIKPYRIPSGSMIPTLDVGQRVLVNRLGHRFGDPEIGDIVVFHPPAGADSPSGPQCAGNPPAGQVCLHETKRDSESVNFIKRVVAGPGDRLSIRDGHVVLNGKVQKEPFIRPCAGGGACNLPRTVTIPAGHWFMMGDNRGSSDDSRYWGPVPEKWIIGQAFATYWPPSRIGIL
jgi:signal peptidase I